MDINTKIFLRKKFKEYYWKNSKKIKAPIEIEKREFGIGTLDKKIKARHKSFSTEIEMQNYLKREAPFFISYSAAYYEFPSNEPMSSKNWLGADLVFDLDMEMPLLNKEKLQKVKKEIINLRDFLLNDFGFSQQEIEINFSGSQGYHIHVISKKIKNLGSDERREILDYISGNINLNEFWYPESNIIRGPKKEEYGWRGRIWNELYNFLKNSNINELKKTPGIGEKKAKIIINNRDKILDDLKKGIYNSLADVGVITFDTVDVSRKVSDDPNVSVKVIKRIRSKVLQKIIKAKAISVSASTDVDKMVTIDTSRLMRLPDSLHGGSGLIAKKVLDIDKFNPLIDAIAFKEKEEITIKLNRSIEKFDFINEEKVGPFKEGIARVSTPLAIYLILKGFGNFLKF